MSHSTNVNGAARRAVVAALATAGLLLSAAAVSLPAAPMLEPTSGASVLHGVEAHLTAGRFDQALTRAGGIDVSRLEAEHRVQLQRMKGYAYARQGAYAPALEAYGAILDSEAAADTDTLIRTRYTLAQLSFALERFHESVEHLQAWQRLAAGREDDFRPLVLLGQAYFKIGDRAAAIGALEQALERARASGADVREHWVALLGHLHDAERRQPAGRSPPESAE